MIEGNLEVKLLTVRTNGKAEVGRVRKEKGRRKRSKKSKTEEGPGAQNEKIEKL
jgi:hypothetical protein